jgi:hypothetical protein
LNSDGGDGGPVPVGGKVEFRRVAFADVLAPSFREVPGYDCDDGCDGEKMKVERRKRRIFLTRPLLPVMKPH